MAEARLTVVGGTKGARRNLALLILLYLLALWLAATALHGEEGTPIHITRAAGPITIDADLSDPGWKGATRLETWFETNPGDNLPAKIKSVGYLTYDDRFFYAAFEFSDPDPSRIRAPFADRDNVSGDTDYGGIIINPHNDGRTALLLLANPRGIQYDAGTASGTTVVGGVQVVVSGGAIDGATISGGGIELTYSSSRLI